MLMGALAIFTLVAGMGLMMFFDVWRNREGDRVYPAFHGVAAVIASALVIAAALNGDTRLYLNIGLAGIIIALGVWMGLLRQRGRSVPRAVLALHALLAVGCYGILAFYTFNPTARLL